ncbi:MAG: hypothetical protein LUC43_04760 [Burkholderiales bacterium]|nr:hypothetical protein [Burkholderiales bacterium]
MIGKSQCYISPRLMDHEIVSTRAEDPNSNGPISLGLNEGISIGFGNEPGYRTAKFLYQFTDGTQVAVDVTLDVSFGYRGYVRLEKKGSELVKMTALTEDDKRVSATLGISFLIEQEMLPERTGHGINYRFVLDFIGDKIPSYTIGIIRRRLIERNSIVNTSERLNKEADFETYKRKYVEAYCWNKDEILNECDKERRDKNSKHMKK